jgi:hypothetical protein
MSKSNQKEKLVEIKFNPKRVQCSDASACIYGVQVELKGKSLVGQCPKEVFDALVSAGKAE